MVLFVKLIQLSFYFISFSKTYFAYCWFWNDAVCAGDVDGMTGVGRGNVDGMNGVGTGDFDGMTGFVYKVFLVITSIKQGFYR